MIKAADTFPLMILLLLTVSCGTRNGELRYPKPSEILQPVSPQPAGYSIQPGDQLDIKFFYNPELNETVTVRPDGKISLQLIDDVQAAGITPGSLDKRLTADYSSVLKKPEVTVIVRSFTGQRVYVGGEVARPGLIDLTGSMNALQAVLNAGGFIETADPAAAIVIRKDPENRPVPIRVDLTNVLRPGGEDAGFPLEPYDIVYVPKSFIAKANKFVNQYVENLLLFRGVSVGFGYRLNDDDDDD